MEDPRIISALFIFLKMAYYNVLINTKELRSDKIFPSVFFSFLFLNRMFSPLPPLCFPIVKR